MLLRLEVILLEVKCFAMSSESTGQVRFSSGAFCMALICFQSKCTAGLSSVCFQRKHLKTVKSFPVFCSL